MALSDDDSRRPPPGSRDRPRGQTPLPYAGQDVERLTRLGAPFTLRGYGHDRERDYRFNALGYRGADFDPRAAHRVYAFGESHAFGYFVSAEESWPARFAALWIEERGLDPAAVTFQNFADVGAGNSQIARALVNQCSAAPPDLVLVHFGEHRRGEVFLGGRPHRIGPWLLDAATKEAAPDAGPLRDLYLEQIERGRHFYDFALGGAPDLEAPSSLEREATCLEETLRQILLVQYFCQARGLEVIATADRADVLFHDAVRRDPHLGPLLAQIDADFLRPTRLWDVAGEAAEDGGHADAARHRRFARALFERYLSSRSDSTRLDPAPTLDPPPDRFLDPAPARGDGEIVAAERVRGFYDRMPFNYWRSPEEAAERVEAPDALAAYPDLVRLLDRGEVHRAFDFGCGGGWLSATLAVHHGLEVTGVDFSARSLERARALAQKLDLTGRVRFLERDLLTLVPEELGEPADLALSLGVLHHTADPRAAYERVAATVRPGGHLYLGLYHGPGRAPFLEHFRRLTLTTGQETAFEAFCTLRGAWHGDDAHARSWFRDQVLHPHESRHTLREVVGWLEETGFELESTSINRFAPVPAPEELFALENDYAERARQALEEGRFFPGFFTVLARRRGGPGSGED